MPNIDNGTRCQIVSLKAAGFSVQKIADFTGVGRRTIQRIYKKALDRGFDPQGGVLLISHVSDAPRSGRPSKKQNAKDGVTEHIQNTHQARELSCEANAQANPHLDTSA